MVDKVSRYMIEGNTSFNSMSEFLTKGSDTEAVTVKSFYPNWEDTNDGPKGESKWHHDGTTGGTPTVNTTSSIISAMATGKVISADGKGWVMSKQDYNYYQFGALMDGTTDDTAAFNAALAHADFIKHVGGAVTAIVSGIVISSAVVAHGDKLVTLSNSGIATDQPIIEIDSNDVRINGFYITNANASLTSPVVKLTCTTERQRISWRDNWITNTASCYAFHVTDLIYDFTYRDNVIESPLNPDSDNSRGLYFGQSSTGTTSTKRITIRDNKFRYGSYGCDFVGSGSQNGPIFIRDNEFLGQDTTALHLYHCRRWEATGNHFVNISAQSRPNNDNGAVFLDTLSPVTLTTTGKFNNNTFVNITGNAIYVEECVGIEISGNELLSVAARSADTYTYPWTIGVTTANSTSDGGCGILVTGGCYRLNIHDNYIQQARFGVKIDRSIGSHPEYASYNITVRDNVITRCADSGVVIKEKVEGVRVINNDIFNCGGAGDSSAIVVDRQNTDVTNYAETITIANNDTTPDASLTNNQARGYYEKYNVAHTLKMHDNKWHVSGSLNAVVANSVSGRIVDNEFVSGGLSLTTPSESLLVYGNTGSNILSRLPYNSATTAQLTSLASDVNTRDKYIGKPVWNTTTNVLLIASGTAANSHWYTAAGIDTYTPV